MRLKLKYFAFGLLFLCIQFTNLLAEELILNDSILSADAEISLLTFERGKGVANIWGHSGIRVKDDSRGIDIVYNYGTYDFEAPNFLMKFLRGKLDYTLSTSRFEMVSRYYVFFKRSIIEQVLNLDHEEKIKLYQLLEENALPENKYYKYDFFFDNCSTRPMSMIEKCLNGKIILKEEEINLTFRQLLDWQIWDQHWLDFGIDLIIGSKADKIPSSVQSSFLPLKLREKLGSAVVSPSLSYQDNNSDGKKLVKKENIIASFEPEYNKLPQFFQPVWFFLLLFLLEIFLFYLSYRHGKIKYKWYDNFWFSIVFAGSLIIVFLWFFTDHIATKANWNIIVFSPLFIFMLMNYNRFKYYIGYLLVFILCLFLIFNQMIPQQIHTGVLLITGILMLKTAKYSILKNYFIK